MKNKILLGLVIGMMMFDMTGVVQASPIQILADTSSRAIVDARIFDVSQGYLVVEGQSDSNIFNVPSSGGQSDSFFQTSATSNGIVLDASVESKFIIDSTGLFTENNGRTFSSIVDAEADFVGSASSYTLQRLSIFVDSPIILDWDYQMTGIVGPVGTNNGLRLQIKIDQFTDDSFLTSLNLVTHQFFTSGSGSQSYSLTPGYYFIAFEGYDAFSGTPSALNKDGEGSWWYSASIHTPSPVPEPATMFLFGLGLLGVAGVSRKKN